MKKLVIAIAAAASKNLTKGTYRVKVRYGYRYWNAQTKTYGAWHNLDVTKTIRLR